VRARRFAPAGVSSRPKCCRQVKGIELRTRSLLARSSPANTGRFPWTGNRVRGARVPQGDDFRRSTGTCRANGPPIRETYTRSAKTRWLLVGGSIGPCQFGRPTQGGPRVEVAAVLALAAARPQRPGGRADFCRQIELIVPTRERPAPRAACDRDLVAFTPRGAARTWEGAELPAKLPKHIDRGRAVTSGPRLGGPPGAARRAP